MDPTVQLIEDLADLALGRRTEITRSRASFDRAAADPHLIAAAENASVDSLPIPPGRNRGMKKLILKVGRFVFTRQRAYNQAVLATIQGSFEQVEALTASVDQERSRAAAEAASFEALLHDAEAARHRRIDEILQILADIVPRLAIVEGHLDDQRAELVLERHRRGILERELRVVRAEGRSSNTVSPDEVAGPALNDTNLYELYERFEQHFRPTGESLDERFSAYLPDLAQLRDGHLPLLDLGTGRGDFLGVLREAGIPAVGLDANPEAVESARAQGHDVVLGGAMEHLSAQPNESLGAITAFHVVEHLEAADLVSLIDEMVRVLAPGGVVILETPNPTNLVVGAASFYHDPTHVRPVTPDYLSFLLHDRGLIDVETRFLHPLPEFDLPLTTAGVPGELPLGLLLKDLQWALKGPMDYAIIARGPGRV